MKKYLSIALLTGSLLMSGCGDSENFVFVDPVFPPVTAAPICADDAYTTDANTALTVNAANGVLANDTPNGGTVTAFTATSTQGGTVNVNGNGSFTYTPANGFTGTDTFTYTLQNSGGQVTCTVTITVNAIDGFFVDAVNGDDGTGDFDGGLPFASIQAAVAAAPTGADIVVRPGNYTGAVNLKDGQRLLGSGSVLVNAQGTLRPELTGPIVMADGNTLDFLRVEGTNGSAVDGDGQTDGIVTNCEIVDITNLGAGVVGDGADGSWNISNNTISNFAGIGITFRTTGNQVLTVQVTNNDITGGELSAIGLYSENSSNITAIVTENIMRANASVAGDGLEVEALGTSTFCLDLEDNVNDLDANPGNGEDGVYSLFDSPGSPPVLRVEQFTGGGLTMPKPTGAGNTGIIDDNTGIGGDLPTSVADGTCSL
jgi:hypothetical protein